MPIVGGYVYRLSYCRCVSRCKGTAIFWGILKVARFKVEREKGSTFVEKNEIDMKIYDLLRQLKGTELFDDLFRCHIFCNGLRISFERYDFLLRLQAQFPEETHFHLVQDTCIHFHVSEQTIYTDIGKMEMDLAIQPSAC